MIIGKLYTVANGRTNKLELTSGQTTPIGEILGHLFYSNELLLDMIKHSGYPHNGGQHSLTITGDKLDIVAWLELVIEHYITGKFAVGANELKTLKDSLV